MAGLVRKVDLLVSRAEGVASSLQVGGQNTCGSEHFMCMCLKSHCCRRVGMRVVKCAIVRARVRCATPKSSPLPGVWGHRLLPGGLPLGRVLDTLTHSRAHSLSLSLSPSLSLSRARARAHTHMFRRTTTWRSTTHTHTPLTHSLTRTPTFRRTTTRRSSATSPTSTRQPGSSGTSASSTCQSNWCRHSQCLGSSACGSSILCVVWGL